MKVVVIGGRGMLGRAVLDTCQAQGWEVAGYDLPEMDITHMDGREVEEADWVVNCAAYTKVDQAEVEATKCFEVNACGAGWVARMCRERGMRHLYVSTDYVFDGLKQAGPYDEHDEPHSLNMYGSSKLIGESLVGSECPGTLIVRTQSLFGEFGMNFVKAILKQVEDGKKELKVVEDQISCPTWVVHLARAMVKLMERKVEGIVHVSAEEACSWYEFAQNVLSLSGKGLGITVTPVKTGEFPVKAERPAWSVLCKARYEIITGEGMPTWKDGLREYLRTQRPVSDVVVR